MAYCKVEVNTGFTVISNELMRDKRITLKAKGLQALILSLPPEWDMTIEGLSAICVECSDTISSILKELEAAGYLSRYRERNSNGRYGPMQYTFFQSPIHNKPIRNSPNRKNSGRVKPGWDISGQLSKEQSNKEELNKGYSDILYRKGIEYGSARWGKRARYLAARHKDCPELFVIISYVCKNNTIKISFFS